MNIAALGLSAILAYIPFASQEAVAQADYQKCLDAVKVGPSVAILKPCAQATVDYIRLSTNIPRDPKNHKDFMHYIAVGTSAEAEYAMARYTFDGGGNKEANDAYEAALLVTDDPGNAWPSDLELAKATVHKLEAFEANLHNG